MTQRISHYPDVVEIDAKPDGDMVPGTLYLIGPPGKPYLIGLICPCGCRCELLLPVRGAIQGREGRDAWDLERLSPSIVSLNPSIHIRPGNGCGAHFWLKNNRIKWA